MNNAHPLHSNSWAVAVVLRVLPKIQFITQGPEFESYYLDSEHRLTVSSHVAKVVDLRVIILLKNDSFLAGFLSSPPKAENVARPMETSGGPKPGKRESGSGSSPDGTDSEDFVMVPAHLTMDAAEIRKHHNRGVVP